jgi:rhodanese-related sulfurtransferase
VAAVTEGQPPRPGYFARVAELNRESHQLADVETPEPLSLEEVLRRQAGGAVVLDVRSPGELDPARPVVTFCAGGYRSSIAASLLRSWGFADVSDLIGGYQAWQAAT